MDWKHLQESGADQEEPIDIQPRKIQDPQTGAFGDFGPLRACRRQALPGTLGGQPLLVDRLPKH
jgi:hypothetical protein